MLPLTISSPAFIVAFPLESLICWEGNTRDGCCMLDLLSVCFGDRLPRNHYIPYPGSNVPEAFSSFHVSVVLQSY